MRKSLKSEALSTSELVFLLHLSNDREHTCQELRHKNVLSTWRRSHCQHICRNQSSQYSKVIWSLASVVKMDRLQHTIGFDFYHRFSWTLKWVRQRNLLKKLRCGGTLEDNLKHIPPTITHKIRQSTAAELQQNEFHFFMVQVLMHHS